MTKALLKAGVLLIAVLGTAVAINWSLIPNNYAAYQAAKLDKLDMIQRMESPKVVLVGGSNLAFSIDSQLLADRFDMPVINMGLAKSVGMEYMLEEVKPFIGQGDIVVLAFEYELYYDLFYGSDGIVVELQYVPEGFKNMRSFGQYRTFASKFGPMMQAKFSGFVRKGSTGKEDDVYQRAGFNDYGDLVTHLDAEPQFQPRSIFEHGAPFQQASVDVLNEFYLEMLNRGARVVLSAPPLVDVEFERYAAKIDGLYDHLSTALSLPVISDPRDYVFREDQMFDTAYHLLRAGRTIRTLQLLDDLDRTNGIGIGGTAT